VLGERVVRLEHVGSTSAPGLAAKPIIDIPLVVPDSADEPAYVPDLEAAGYRLVIREPEWFQHRCFKGPDSNVNLHVYSPGCPEIKRYLLFRGRLRAHPESGPTTSGSSGSWPSGTGPTSRSTPTPRPRRSRGSSPEPGRPRGLRAPTALPGAFTTPSRRRGSIGNDRATSSTRRMECDGRW
jgi:GrpB protein